MRCNHWTAKHEEKPGSAGERSADLSVTFSFQKSAGTLQGIWHVGGGDTSEIMQFSPTRCSHLSALTRERERRLPREMWYHCLPPAVTDPLAKSAK